MGAYFRLFFDLKLFLASSSEIFEPAFEDLKPSGVGTI
jgi:hypothetical protein